MSISVLNDKSNAAASAQRLEIFTGAGRRRAWTAEEKAAIVAETIEDGAVVSHVARRHGLTPQQVFAWRRQARRRTEADVAAPAFTPIVVEARAQRDCPMPAARTKRATRGRIQSNWTSTDRASGCGPAPRSRW